jgi:hypothetical protein
MHGIGASLSPVTGLLAVAATLGLAAFLAGGAGRIVALLLAASGLTLPFLLPAPFPMLTFVVALLAFWGLVRVVELCRERQPRPFTQRLWHVFALFDSRATSRVPPRRDRRQFGRAALHLAIGVLGVAVVLLADRFGYAHTAARWLGGTAFVYGGAGAVAELVPALYLLGGIAVPPVQATPIAACSLGELWGQRWNRVVGGWLRATFFRPLARRGRPGTGVLAAFTASAVMHGYVAAAAGGMAVAVPMAAFFVVQGGLVLVERRLHVERWSPGHARAWVVLAMLASLPLFIEPMMAIVVPGTG